MFWRTVLRLVNACSEALGPSASARTRLVQAGADLKSVQGQMRHSRISTTMDIYAQIVPAAQRLAIEKLAEFDKQSAVPLLFQKTGPFQC
jgi:integrase